MNKLLLLISFFYCFGAIAQNAGNEWINYDQTYYSFDIYQTGLFRIDQTSLAAAGVPVGSFSPQNIQIFGREKELPIHIVDGSDNSFDAGDYILFYAERNDGWLDSLKYRDPEFIGNPGYSLVNDTIHYFFTWNNLTTNKRFVPDNSTDFDSYTPISFVVKEISSVNGPNYYSEAYKQDQASGSLYAPGEGYAYVALTATSSNVVYSIPIFTPNPYSGPGAIPPQFHASAVANGSALACGLCSNHHMRMEIGPSNYELLDTAFSFYQHQKITRTLPFSALVNGNTNFNYIIVADLNVANDRQNLNYYRLRYSRITDINGQVKDLFDVPDNTSQAKSRIDLTNYYGSAPLVFSFNGTPRIHTAQQTGSTSRFLIPNVPGGGMNRVYFTDPGQAIAVTTFRPVNHGTGRFTDFSQLSMEEAYLIIKHRSLEQATANYAQYRSSVPGGSHNVIVADIDELYDQYGGGIPKDVMGIRRFALHAWQLAVEKPVAMLLAGEGNTEVGSARYNVSDYAYSKIPTFGYPPSDMAITSGLAGTNWEPLIPTGRIAAANGQQIDDYRIKIEAYEAQQGPNSTIALDNEWQKQILHFVGGANTQQQQTFRYHMDEMAGIISDSLFGANVTSYYKTSSDPLDPNVVEGVTDRIAEGVSIMNFFSHAASSNNGFEINIDAPENWNNTGRYPLVIGNSCYNGNIFANGQPSQSEHFVLLPNEGSIGFISPVIVGYDSYLAMYSKQLYREMSRFSYSQPLGLQMKRTIQAIQFPDPTLQNAFLESTCSQMTLHGDPMLKVNWHSAPELSIAAESVFFTPEDLDLTVDSIDVNIVITNLGSSAVDTFAVEVRRNFPQSNVDSVFVIQVPQLNYKDTIVLRIPMQPGIGVGENVFTVRVDLPSMLTEEYEEVANNQLMKSLFIRVDGIQPIWPYDFAVVPIDSVTVKASTIDPISQNVRTYLFELDTVHYYNSPQYRRFSVTGTGGIKQVDPSQWLSASGNPFPLVCEDSTVYFWRVAVDSSVIVWNEFSFQYIPGKNGWGQDHFFQFRKNDFFSLQYDTLNRRLNFPPPEAHEVTIDVYNYETFYTAWFIDGEVGDYGVQQAVIPAGFYVFVIDPITLAPWRTRYGTQNADHAFGNANDNPGMSPTIGQGTDSDAYFTFSQNNPAQLAGMENMLENEIPAGYYVGIYSSFSTEFETVSNSNPSLINTFANLGATIIDSPQDSMPFAIFYRNGFPNTLVETPWPTDPSQSHVHLSATVYTSDDTGLETTPLIGPSLNWQTVYWRRDSLEAFPADSVRLRIEAYNSEKILQTTIDTVFTPNDSIMQLNNFLSASSYPYIKLGMLCSDNQFGTPAQIERLHVLYQPVPEAAIDGGATYYISQTPGTLVEGQSASFAVDIRNVSAWPMDSLLVRYWIEDQSHVKHFLTYGRQDSLRVSETLRDTITFSTVGYPGANSLWMELNPYVNGSFNVTDQPEQFHFNNLLQLPFFVEEDDVQPILDVTFNGVHILNEDIVSPESEVVITLKDDNIYRVMDNVSDTTLFGIYLTDPQGIQRRVPFIDQNGQMVMQWIPANAQNLKFRIVWPAEFEQDGKYTLFVQGTDRNGNVSGDLEYRIAFEVVHESSITYMMNYPNPFSTSTRFVFTLTGSEVPDDIIIQIMTVTGRVVREITEAELGRLTIGRNISDFSWDGTDEFGDQLANGVYLYRVKAKLNGEDIKHRESTADNYFKKEFGKMYLMR
jgi:hypothetical protein